MIQRKRETAVLVLLVFLSVILMAADQGGRLRTARGLRLLVLGPFEKAGSILSNILDLREENRRLTDIALRAALEKEALIEEILRTKKAKDLREFSGSFGLDLVLAEVVARPAERFSSSVTIDKGTRDGVQKGMVVLTTDGVAGKVEEAFKGYSVVELITSGRYSVAGVVPRTRVHGIVTWESPVGALRMKDVPSGEDVREGDVVFSSGMGGVFPGGLRLGTVIRVGAVSAGFLKEILIEPSVRMARLEEVSVLRSFKGIEIREKTFMKDREDSVTQPSEEGT